MKEDITYHTSFCRSVKSELISSGVMTLFLFFLVGPFFGCMGFLLEGGSLKPVPPIRVDGRRGGGELVDGDICMLMSWKIAIEVMSRRFNSIC